MNLTQFNRKYNTIIKDALSTTGLENTGKQDRTANIRREIGEKSSLDALVRLTGDKTYPMDKNFLVGAGKNVTTEGVGWIKAEVQPGQVFSFDTVSAKSESVFSAISKSPEASAELMNNPDFVKNGLRMSNMSPMDRTAKIGYFNQIIEAGTSAEAKAKSPEKVEKAIVLLAETIGDTSLYRPQDLPRISGDVLGMPREKVVSESMANTLAKVVSANPQVFIDAVRRNDTEKSYLDGSDVQNIFVAVSQYPSSKAELESTIKVEVSKMMLEGTDFSKSNSEISSKIGQLLDVYAKADKSSSMKEAADKDKRIEMAANIFNDVAGLIPFGDLPMQSLTKLAMASTQRRITEMAKDGTGGNYVGLEKDNLEKKEAKLRDSINFIALKSFEQSAYRTLTNKDASLESKQKAAKFLEDIKIYNQAMPADEKILDANGKLVDPFAPTTNGGQRNNLVNLAQGDVITKYKKTPGTEEASRRIGDIVRPTAETIELKVKGSYQP